jgi:hypothetical protein
LRPCSMRVGIGETVQAARLVHKVKPIYPPKSTLAGIEETV